MAGLWVPQSDTRGPSAGSAWAEEEPEQQPQASFPRRRPTGVTIREPASTPRTERPLAPLGKGKQKGTELADISDDSSHDNGIVISLLNNLPIPCHLFDGDGNFKNAPILNSDFFQAVSSSVNNVATNSCSAGTLLVISSLSFFGPM